LDTSALLDLFQWSELDFDRFTQGSPIRRLGYERWLRNLAVALGNAPANQQILETLKNSHGDMSPMVDEHIVWAIKRLEASMDLKA